MNENSSDQLTNLVSEILSDYASTCRVEPYDGKIIISGDMADAYKEIRGDLVKKRKINTDELNKYHGLTVQPLDNNGKFTILLNLKYVSESKTKGNVDWLGTLIHEATHVNDFKDYFKIIHPASYDELYEFNLHRIFLYWTEFHARATGHYFLRKYSLNNFKDKSHISYILETELPFHINYLVQETSATQEADRQMYVIMHFLGRIAVWQYLYPETFDDNFIQELTNSNQWLKELYAILIKYKSLNEIYPHFDELETIIDKHYADI